MRIKFSVCLIITIMVMYSTRISTTVLSVVIVTLPDHSSRFYFSSLLDMLLLNFRDDAF